jgi:hypothetical protein
LKTGKPNRRRAPSLVAVSHPMSKGELVLTYADSVGFRKRAGAMCCIHGVSASDYPSAGLVLACGESKRSVFVFVLATVVLAIPIVPSILQASLESVSSRCVCLPDYLVCRRSFVATYVKRPCCLWHRCALSCFLDLRRSAFEDRNFQVSMRASLNSL